MTPGKPVEPGSAGFIAGGPLPPDIKPGSSRGARAGRLQDGRYEFVALPVFGVGRMAATIDPDLARSTLTVHQFHVYQRGNRTRVAFELDDPRDCAGAVRKRTAEILSTVDMVWPDGNEERLIAVRGHFVLGDRLSSCDLYLTKKRLRSTQLVLGRSFTGSIVSADAGSAFTAGTPDRSVIATVSGVEC